MLMRTRKKIFLFILAVQLVIESAGTLPDDLEPVNQCIRRAKDVSGFDFW